MIRRALELGLAILVTLVTSATPVSAQPAGGDTLAAGQARTIPITKGALLRIRGVVGGVEIRRGTGPDAVVTAAYTDGPAAPRIVLIADGTGTTICAVHASPNPKKPNECLPGHKGRLLEGLKRDWPFVGFRVELPDGVDVAAELAEGNIQADTGSGGVWLKTFRGDLSVIDHGAQAITGDVVAGALTVILAAASPHAQRHVNLTLAGGEMRVEVPSRTVAIHYSISSDANIRTPFKLVEGAGLRIGDLGAAGPSEIFLTMNSASPVAKLFLAPLSDPAAK